MLTILLCLLLQGLCAQEFASVTLLRTYPGFTGEVQLDNMGNLYLVVGEGSVKKMGPGGDSLAIYNQVRRNGKLFGLDVSNALRPLLFYKDFAQVVVLDRFLAPQFTLDLRRSGIRQPTAVVTSFDNKIWVFDALTNKLKKVDDAGAVVMETPDLRQVFGTVLQPDQIIDHNSWVYLYDPLLGLYVFDYFGNFKRKIPVAGWRHLLVTNQFIYGIKEGALHRYATGTLIQDRQHLPEAVKACSQVRLYPGKLLAVCSVGLQVYKLQ